MFEFIFKYFRKPNYDNECTCEMVDWDVSEDGSEVCPYCEMWAGEIDVGCCGGCDS